MEPSWMDNGLLPWTNHLTPPRRTGSHTHPARTIKPHRPVHIPTQILPSIGCIPCNPQIHLLDSNILTWSNSTTLKARHICRLTRTRDTRERKVPNLKLGVGAVSRGARERRTLGDGKRGAFEIVGHEVGCGDVGCICFHS